MLEIIQKMIKKNNNVYNEIALRKMGQSAYHLQPSPCVSLLFALQ